MNICQNPNCGKETTNPKYCCKSCAAIVNNAIFPKKTRKPHYCKYCGAEIFGRTTVCGDCNPSKVDWSKITYDQISSRPAYQKNSRIRTLARKLYQNSNKPQKCMMCGYDKHFHVCHIKPISSFPGHTAISTINDLDNLVALCPNHHWEFDHNILTL
jgi:hypothetical protein